VSAVRVFPSAGGAALTVAACSPCGQLFTWLDATTNSAPQQFTLAQAAPDAPRDVVAAFEATPYSGPDAPGFLGVVSLADSSLIFVSVTQHGTVTHDVEAGAAVTTARRGLLHALGDAVVGQLGGWGELMNLSGVRRSHASRSPAVGACIAHQVRLRAPASACAARQQHLTGGRVQGGACWTALVLSSDALDCWHASFLATGALALQVAWSLDVSAALGQRLPHARSAALSFALLGSQLCVLAAVQRVSMDADWQLALAFLDLPLPDASGASGADTVWGLCCALCALRAHVCCACRRAADVQLRGAVGRARAAAQ